MRRPTVALWVLVLTPALAFAQNTESRRSLNQSKLQRLKPTQEKLGYGRAEARPSEGNRDFAHGAAKMTASSTERRGDQYYVFVAPGGDNFTFGSTTGTLHFGGGGEGFFYKGLAIGAEAGFLAPMKSFSGGSGLVSVDGSYHFSSGKTKKVVPFISGGYSLLFGSGGANGLNFGGGVNWWMRDRLALRLEARDHILSVGVRPTPQAWEFRIGFSFR